MANLGMTPLSKEQAVDWHVFSQFMWGISDLCFSTYDRLRRLPDTQSANPQQRYVNTKHHASQENDMSTLGNLWRYITGGPAHNQTFVNLVENAARAFGYQTSWDNEQPNCCVISIPFAGETYFLCLSLEGIHVFLTLRSKVHPANCPRDMPAGLARRSQELPWGEWRMMDDHFVVVSSMRVRDLGHLSDAIAAMAGEVTAFDRTCQRYGYV
jgi:hypothetical protein